MKFSYNKMQTLMKTCWKSSCFIYW